LFTFPAQTVYYYYINTEADMDYYTAPDDHPDADLLGRLEEKMNQMCDEIKQMQGIDRDWTSDEEDHVYDLEARIKELDQRITNVFYGDTE
jgi:wobble nucleotide-excising tRNase